MGGSTTWRRSHRARESESSVEGTSREEELAHDFHFSEDEGSSCSSDDDQDVFMCVDFPLKCPNAPRLSYDSPPETPRDSTTPIPPLTPTHAPVDAGSSLRAQRPIMRLDLSSLPPAFGGANRLSPFGPPTSRPMSRFSSDDGSSPGSSSAPASALTPGTENAWSAFGILAAGRRSPAGGLLSSPMMASSSSGVRGRRRIIGDMAEGSHDRLEHRQSSPRPPSSPLAQLAISANHDDTSSPMGTPLLDYEGARAVYHRLLPGSHALLKTGNTPATEPALESSYFAVAAQ